MVGFSVTCTSAWLLPVLFLCFVLVQDPSTGCSLTNPSLLTTVLNDVQHSGKALDTVLNLDCFVLVVR